MLQPVHSLSASWVYTRMFLWNQVHQLGPLPLLTLPIRVHHVASYLAIASRKCAYEFVESSQKFIFTAQSIKFNSNAPFLANTQ